jgi:hypothetical protein
VTDDDFDLDALARSMPTDTEGGVYFHQLRVRQQHIAGRPCALDGDMTIEAVPSWYGGITFRSKLEADWAATLDHYAIRWDYEPETITLPSGANYIPDFWLPELGTWLEVKGTGVPRIEKTIELGEVRACHCESDCTCQWPGGELVLIGHPPTRSPRTRHTLTQPRHAPTEDHTMTQHRIEHGQEYESCHPLDNIRIRVVGEPVTTSGLYGFGKVRVATLTESGRELRPRAIAMNQLHDSGTTRDGQPRRTGYRLVRNADGTTP